MLKFSIIIPTYKRASGLRLTIESLFRLDYPKKDYEIVIVDNNSQDNTREVVMELIKKSPVRMRYLLEKKPGLMNAHHCGARAARGKIFYFTDDDIIVTKSLLTELEKVFETDKRIACVTGKILPVWEQDPPGWILKYFNNHMLSVNAQRNERLLISPHDVGVFGCHEAVKRSVLFETGGFNPDYVGPKMMGDGETGLSLKIEKLGYLFAYTSEAVIYNAVPKERLTQRYINRRFFVQGRADSYTDLRKYSISLPRLIIHLCYYLYRLITTLTFTLFYFPFSEKWHLACGHIYYFLARMEYDLEFLFDTEIRRFVLKKNWL